MGCGDSRLQTINIGKQIPAGLGPIFQRRIHEIRRRRIRQYTLLASGEDNNTIIDNEVNKLCPSFPNNNNNNCSSRLSSIKTCCDSDAGDNGDMDDKEKSVRRHDGPELIFSAGSPSFRVYLQEDHKNDDALINYSTVPSEETASLVEQASKDSVCASKKANKCRKKGGKGITRRVIGKGGGRM